MPRSKDDADDWDEDDDDSEGFDDEEAETVPCPHCGRAVDEDAERCPYCEHYLSSEDAITARKPLWIIIGTGLSLIIVYFWIRSHG